MFIYSTEIQTNGKARDQPPKMKAALKNGYGKESYTVGCGGSLPLIPLFQEHFSDMAIYLVGIEDPYTKAHSENESQDLGDYIKAIRF